MLAVMILILIVLFLIFCAFCAIVNRLEQIAGALTHIARMWSVPVEEEDRHS